MRFRLVPKASTLDDFELLYVGIFTDFCGYTAAGIYYDSPGSDTFVGYLLVYLRAYCAYVAFCI